MTKSIRSNINKLYAREFLFELIFFIPILVPFFEGLGFTMQQILILEASFASTLVLMEIPSGYFADLYGRKTALIINSIINFIGITIFILSSSFWGFLAGEIILGIGLSFGSGSNEAMLYETLLEIEANEKYKKIQGNVFFYGRLGSIISNITGSLIAITFLKLPFYLTLIPFAVALLITLTLIEPKRHERNFETWKHFKRICKETVIDNKRLRNFLIFAAIAPGFFLMTFWLYQKYMIFVELPIVYFGTMIAFMNILSAIGGKYAQEIEKKISPKLSLILISIIPAIVWITLSNVKSILALPLFAITSLVWGMTTPIFQDFIQKIVSSDRRATVLSIRNFLIRGLFLLLAPFLGWITDLYEIQTALFMAAVIFLVLSSISLLTLKKVKII